MKRALLALLLLSASAWATTIRPMSVEELARRSTQIVEARALESWSEWQGNRVYTYTRFQVLRTLKGEAPGSVVVRQLGGSAAGYTMKVAGVRRWRSGDESVLFLQPSRQQAGVNLVTGLMQGDFRIRKSASGERYVSNGVPGVSAYARERGYIADWEGDLMTLNRLETRILRAVTE